MYLPKHFEQLDVEAMHELMQRHPLGTLITIGPDGLCADHVPLHFLKESECHGVLRGHVPRSNPVWQHTSAADEPLIIFQGPDAYITPSWYATKKETGKVVPTWNYAVVHVYGSVRAIEDAAWIRTHLEQLTDQQEGSFSDPWAVSDAPHSYTEALIASLVGIEVTITRMIGKWKVSQNRHAADREGVAAGLIRHGGPGECQMADLVKGGKR